MRKTTQLLSLLAVLGMSACTYPTTTVQTVDTRPRLAIANASPTAMLSLNGVVVGPAADYDGKKATLQVERGTHKVEITDGGRVVLTQTIYLGDDLTKTITVPR